MRKNRHLKEQIENSTRIHLEQKKIFRTRILKMNDEKERGILLDKCQKCDDLILETIHDLIDKHYDDVINSSK